MTFGEEIYVWSNVLEYISLARCLVQYTRRLDHALVIPCRVYKDVLVVWVLD